MEVFKTYNNTNITDDEMSLIMKECSCVNVWLHLCLG